MASVTILTSIDLFQVVIDLSTAHHAQVTLECVARRHQKCRQSERVPLSIEMCQSDWL